MFPTTLEFSWEQSDIAAMVGSAETEDDLTIHKAGPSFRGPASQR
jgi:hypothetical protein